jgi:hypothetical protein
VENLVTVLLSDYGRRAVTSGGKAYAGFWIAVVAARVYFTYGAQHVFSAHRAGSSSG